MIEFFIRKMREWLTGCVFLQKNGYTMEYVIGIDLGTSYFKVGLVDRNGKLCGREDSCPRSGDCLRYSEVSVDGFVTALKEGIAAALTEGKARRRRDHRSFLLLSGKQLSFTR